MTTPQRTPRRRTGARRRRTSSRRTRGRSRCWCGSRWTHHLVDPTRLTARQEEAAAARSLLERRQAAYEKFLATATTASLYRAMFLASTALEEFRGSVVASEVALAGVKFIAPPDTSVAAHRLNEAAYLDREFGSVLRFRGTSLGPRTPGRRRSPGRGRARRRSRVRTGPSSARVGRSRRGAAASVMNGNMPASAASTAPCQLCGPASQACAALIADETVVSTHTSVHASRALCPRCARRSAARPRASWCERGSRSARAARRASTVRLLRGRAARSTCATCHRLSALFARVRQSSGALTLPVAPASEPVGSGFPETKITVGRTVPGTSRGLQEFARAPDERGAWK